MRSSRGKVRVVEVALTSIVDTSWKASWNTFSKKERSL
jgi:hypothetical protein